MRHIFTRKGYHFFIGLLLTLCQYSCTAVLNATGNIKKPAYEPVTAVEDFASDEHAAYDALFVARDEQQLIFFTDTITNKLPAVLIFNRERVNIFTDRTCPWSTIHGLDALQGSRDTSTTAGRRLTLQQVLTPLVVVKGAWPDENGLQQYDYFVFYTWAKFAPKMSRKMMRDVSRLAKTNSKLFIGAINLDLQQAWKN